MKQNLFYFSISLKLNALGPTMLKLIVLLYNMIVFFLKRAIYSINYNIQSNQISFQPAILRIMLESFQTTL